MEDLIFSPSFGNRPKKMVGRDNVLTDLMRGLSENPGSKERATLLLGQRGNGKTVLLLEIAQRAKDMGYIVASPTIVSGDMLGRIVEKLQDEGEKYVSEKKIKLSGGSIGFPGFSVGLQFTREEQETKSFAYKLSKLCKALDKCKKGVLILIDELQANNNDLRQLIIAYQEIVGEEGNIAIVMAGLPGAVSATLNDHVLTFLNRAKKIYLEPLEFIDIDRYYIESFKAIGIELSEEQRKTAVDKTQGSPYLMQLIGHYIVCYADDTGCISEENFQRALILAEKDFENDVCRTALNALSDKDIEFLQAMVSDEKESSMADISERMKVGKDYAQQYKRRLIDNGIIEQHRRGKVRIIIPYLREYMISELKE